MVPCFTSDEITVIPIAILTPKVRLNPTTACFVALYTGVTFIPCPRPAIDPVLTTVPPFPPLLLSMYFKASRVPWMTPFCKDIKLLQHNSH